ncbi:MAG TPA: DUF397 domain-containing protein [Jiangellales bacterium]|nr:DUF397 domain-containing protein [Jiangellales bacterium]
MLRQDWTISTESGGSGQCVEVRLVTAGVEVRDSKNPDGPTLLFTVGEWDAFLAGAKRGEFDI